MTFAGCVEAPVTNYPLGLPLQGAIRGSVEDAFIVLILTFVHFII